MAKKKIIYINYFDGIDQLRVKNLMSLCSNLVSKQKPDELYFLLASQGGDMDSGIAFYNFLKALPVKITMHNIGSIDSIANVIFIAGDNRYASPGTTFLFHGVNINFPSNTPLSISQINEIKDRIDQNHEKIAQIICESTKLEEKEIKKLFLEGKTKDTDFALERNIINKILPPQIPKDAPFVTLNIN